MKNKKVNINELIDFRFSLSLKHNGVLEDRLHNFLIQYWGYSIDKHNWITVKNIRPIDVAFVVELVNGDFKNEIG